MAWVISGSIRGPQGPPGDGGSGGPAFVAITQADYDNLSPPDANTLYLIIAGPATGQGNEWIVITQQDYDLLDPVDPDTLYVVLP